MIISRVGIAIAAVIITIAGAAHAQRAAGDDDASGKPTIELEIDDCPPNDPALSQEQLRARGHERYERGNTLYLQGDYVGAVRELVGSYCATPFYQILKDVGQAYERSLEYEKAIGYLQRYVDGVPPDAKRTSQCAADPQIDKDNVIRRIEVLRRLGAHIFVETNPPNAQITIRSKQRTEAVGKSGEQMEALGGTYEMTVEKAGHVTQRREIVVKIGKPYTFYFELRPLEGRLSVQATPGDARLFLDNRFVGVGRAEESLPSKKYELLVEAPGRIERRLTVEVLPNQDNRLQVELEPRPQFGRRQLIVFSAIGGGIAAGSLLYAFEETEIAGIGSVAGIGAGLVGSYLYLPDAVPLGTSNITITTSLASTLGGFTTALLFTDEQGIIEPITGAATVLGAGAGYYLGSRTKITPGDAALINTSIVWGTAAGALFAVSFDAETKLGAGLTLSGLGMGAVSGILMSRYFEISRTHAALIDVGGIVGLIGGLATESLAYGSNDDSARQQEHVSNFALGGMAVGLIGAGILTRNMDAPKVPMQPTLGRVTDADGASTTTYGISGSW